MISVFWDEVELHHLCLFKDELVFQGLCLWIWRVESASFLFVLDGAVPVLIISSNRATLARGISADKEIPEPTWRRGQTERLLFSQQEETLMPLWRALSPVDYSFSLLHAGWKSMESIGYSQEINYLTQFATMHEPRECTSEMRAHGNAPADKRVWGTGSFFLEGGGWGWRGEGGDRCLALSTK